MNCPFCGKEAQYSAASSLPVFQVYNCYNCLHGWQIEFTDPNASKINYVAIFNDSFMIELDLQNATTKLFDLSKPINHELYVTLNYIVNIELSNLQQWIDRINNIKVFS